MARHARSATKRKITAATTLLARTASVLSALTTRNSRSSPRPSTAIIITPEPAPKYPPYTPVRDAKAVVTGDIRVRSTASVPSWLRRNQREIRGCAPTRTQVKRISHGTIASKTPAGRASSRIAPSTPPLAHVTITMIVTRGCSRSSLR